MHNIKFFDNQTTPVIVLDYNKEIIYTNNSFKRIFGLIKNLERFASRFFFDICLLNSENIGKQNPITFALESKETFFAQTTYQTNKNEFLHFDIHSYITSKIIVITFTETTAQNKYESLLKNFAKLKNEYSELLKENKKFAEIQQKAQSQAIKMALLNRFSNIIRESVDINKIINSALKELTTLLGGFKAYFALNEENSDKLCYKIKLAIPAKYSDEEDKIISFDETVNHSITAKNAHISRCLKEYNESNERFKTNTYRIIIPVFHQSKLLGILVVLSYQNINIPHEDDVLKAISLQLANALMQASLFEQINMQNIQLEETLRELKETQIQLINSEKLASLGQLIAGVAHEINTPLASINSNNSILEKLIKKLENSTLSETFSEINKIDKEAIKRISKIVTSLKQFVRLDEADLQNANINKELDLTLDLIRHETKNKIEIEKNYGEIREIKCYPNMLNQVFMNILMNACQSIETTGKITITTIDSTSDLIIKIKDTGCGIKDEHYDKVFQAGFTSKGVGVGTGLGLAITKKIVEKHNGIIDFTSELGKGTEFTIKIPY